MTESVLVDHQKNFLAIFPHTIPDMLKTLLWWVQIKSFLNKNI